MAFARITLDYAVELITARIDNGQGSPTDAEIAAYCGIDEPVHVRSLLADLADAGRITIRGTGAEREIMLGRVARAPLVPAMPSTALARKASREVDTAVKRITDIVRRKPRDIAAEVAAEAHQSSARRVAAARSGTTIRPYDKAPASPPPRAPEPPVSSPPSMPLGDGGEGAQPSGIPSPVAAAPQTIRNAPAALPPELAVKPKAAPKLEMVRLPTKGARTTRNHMLSISITSDMRDALDARAARSGQSRSWEAFSLLGEALEGKLATSPAKVRVPAHITAAAVREGVPVVAFVADLIERGFREWRGDYSLDRCA